MTDGAESGNIADMPLRFQPELIERARREQGLTYEQLATVAGIPRRTIWNVEHGRSSRPQARTVKALADALGISIADLYEESAPVDGDAA